jgi:chemotaxis protein CheX
MVEKDIQIFIDSVTHYFNQLKNGDITIDTPYLNVNHSPIISDYTGVIGISGNNQGLVYFTAPKLLLEQILQSMGETDRNDSNLFDLVGEIANTIAGNARNHFGPAFNISVPFVFSGQPNAVLLPKNNHSLIISINWHDQQAAIVVYLQ